jgi:hypothetical protein
MKAGATRLKRDSGKSRFTVFNYNGLSATGKKKDQPTNIKKQPVPSTKEDRFNGVTVWETEKCRGQNDFPQQLLQNVYNSPVASAALDVWQEFLEGDGFVDSRLDTLEVNTNGEDGTPETLESLHQKISHDFAYLWGFAVHVGYNSEGQKTEFHHVPFESTRLGILNEDGETDIIKYNPYYGIPASEERRFTKTYYSYNPDPEHVKAQMERHAELLKEKKVDFRYPGQVFWYAVEKPLARVYPQPFYYSSVNWFIVDAKIQLFHERNIDNNFLLSVLINMYGNPDTPIGDGDSKRDQGETVGEAFNNQMRDQMSGAKNGGSAMVAWFMNEAEKADIKPFPTNTHHDLFLALQTIVTNQIAIGTKVPRVLLSIAESGKLGDTQEILNAIRVMQGRVNRPQRVLESKYKKLFEGYEPATNLQVESWEIKNVNPFNILPEWVISSLSPQEKRKYISANYPIELDTDLMPDGTPIQQITNDSLKNLTGKQMQNIQRIVRKFNKEELTYEQAAQLLKSGFGFTDSDVDLYLVTKEEENG